MILLRLTYSKSRCEELYDILSQFTAFKMLTSVDVRFIHFGCVSCDEYPLIFKNGLSQISELLPHLRMVFLNVLELWITDIWLLLEHWECKAKGCRLDNYSFVTNFKPPAWAQYIQK
jgi:hypothetical protein